MAHVCVIISKKSHPPTYYFFFRVTLLIAIHTFDNNFTHSSTRKNYTCASPNAGSLCSSLLFVFCSSLEKLINFHSRAHQPVSSTFLSIPLGVSCSQVSWCSHVCMCDEEIFGLPGAEVVCSL